MSAEESKAVVGGHDDHQPRSDSGGGRDGLGHLGPEDLGQSRVHRLAARTRNARGAFEDAPVLGWPDQVVYGEGIVKVGSFCGHGGDLLGFNTQMLYLPQRDATIVIGVNKTDPYAEPAAVALAWDIISILFPKYIVNGW